MIVGDSHIDPTALIASDVIIGHPSKASLLEHRSLDKGQGATIGAHCILRSGTIVYETAVLGSNIQTAHNVVIREEARIGDGCVFGNGTVVREGAVLGRNVRCMESVVVSEGALVGDNVFIGPNVSFTAGRHMTGAMEAAGKMTHADAAQSEGRYWSGASVSVEDEVRIGANAVILAGVRLGRGCVVAAGSVVSTDVPPGSTVAGNPSRIVKRGPAAPPAVPASVVSSGVAASTGEPEQAPGALRLHHLGIAVPTIQDALPVYRDLFGFRVLSGPTLDPIQKVSVCFLGTGLAGDVVIELIEPASADSPIAGVLRKGAGAYHVCYEVENIEVTVKRFQSQGCRVVSEPVPAAAFDGRRIAWLYTPSRQLVELVQR